MNLTEIKSLISALGFAPRGTDEAVFVKRYSKPYKYSLTIDFHNKRITYGSEIKVNHQRVLGFDDSENFVVLECVNRLLEKGYEPKHIELERMFPVGHNPVAGRADITVYDRKGKTLFVIECKTFGEEYEHAKRKLQTTVGQLFTYRQQDHNTQFLCLYTSRLDGARVVYENLIIRAKDSKDVLEKARKDPEVLAYINAAEAKDFHRVWREQYGAFSTPNGIFDDDVTAYNPAQVPIKRKDLKPFSEEEGRKFFNEFAEILRHNNISDLSNAFNRILSLVLCKIVDEQKAPEEITEFQIQDAKEDAESIQDRLQKLYAEGMGKFLKERIVYISKDQIERVLKNFPNQAAKDRIMTLFIQQKFYSNNEFAFKEVHNERLFRENAKVLIEILQLLQYKQFRYERKDSAEYKKQKRYLGEFFELLLDAGYKQTAGQFFTPLPIAKFIVSSLPIREIIQDKIKQRQVNFLPLLIDYACGSGHFLVEAIEEIQEAVDELESDYDEETNNRIKQWQTTDWTRGFLYGIEKDYRLARTAKLACFMNGDGETNIILGDGLEDHTQTDLNFPQSFDILTANPPYSIKDFKVHTAKSLKHNHFDLMDYLTESASEIEVLFVERLAQLLHATGVCGVILPKSILSNGGIYTKAREVLLRNFELRAIVEFGPNTFMATTTNTATFFLKRRDVKAAIDAEYVADDFITYNTERDNDFADTLGILAEYARTLSFTLADYRSFLSGKPNATVEDSNWYKDYRRWFEDLAEIKKLRKDRRFLAKSEVEQAELIEGRFFTEVKAKEKDKFEFFFLVYGQKTLIVRAHSDKKKERRFLGYAFSRKRGFEGIKLYKQNGKHQTALYDEDTLQNPEKLNFVVRQMLQPELYDYQSNNRIHPIPLPTSLIKQAQIVDLTDCFDFTRIEFEKVINLSARRYSSGPSSNVALTPVHNVCEVKSDKIDPVNLTPEMIYLGLEHIESNTGRLLNVDNTSSVDLQSTKNVFKKGDVLYGKLRPYLNKVYLTEFDGVCSTDILVLKSKHPKLLKYALLDKDFVAQTLDLMKGISLPRLQVKDFLNLNVYFPKTEEAIERTIREIEALEMAEEAEREKIEQARRLILEQIENIKASNYRKYLIRLIAEINPAKTEIELSGDELVSFVEMASLSDRGYIESRVDKPLKEVSQGYTYFRNKDVLFAKITPCMENGKGALADHLTNGIGFGSTEFFVLRANGKILPELLFRFTQDKEFRKEAERNMTGASGHKRVPRSFLENYELALPSIEEQKRIVAEITRLEKQIAEAEEELSKAAEKKADILRKYL